MNKVQKIREEVERLINELIQEKEKGFGSNTDDACIVELQNVLIYINSLQEEPDYCCGECAKWVDGKGCSREKQNTHCITDAACKEGVKKGGKQKPVSEPNKELAETYLAVFDKKFPILPSLKGKQLADYKNFLNKCQQIFGLKEWGIHPIQSKLFEKLTLLWAAWGAKHLQGLGRQDEEEQDIPVSKDLEEVCEQLAENARIRKAETISPFFSPTDYKQGVIDGVNWKEKKDQETVETAIHHAYHNGRLEMKEQMMKDAVDGWVFRDIKDGKLRISDNKECWNGIRIPEKSIEKSYLFCTTDDAIKVKLVIVKED